MTSRHNRRFGLGLAVLLAAITSGAADNAVPMPGDPPSPAAIPMPGDAASVPLPGAAEADPADGGNPWYARRPLRLKLSGYIEDTLSAEWIPSDDSAKLFNNLRGRLNLARSFGGWADAGLTLIATGVQGDTDYDFFPYQSREDRARIRSLGLRDAFIYPADKEEFYAQEAFVTFYADPLRLRMGRHKFYSGTGYAYNPIDLFNRKNPLDPTYEVDGNDAVLATLMLPAETQLTAAVVFEDKTDPVGRDIRWGNKHAMYQLRLKSSVRGWDLALQYTYAIRPRIDYEAGFGMRDFRWRLAAFEFSGELGGVGLYGEAGYAWVDAVRGTGSLSRAAKDHLRLLLGADYTFENQLYVMAEYLHLGQGSSSGRTMGLNERMAFMSGETLAMDKDSLFLGASYPITDLSDLALYAIIGCNAGSAVLNPRYDYKLSDAWNLTVAAYIPLGPADSLADNSGPGGFVRLRYSF